MKKFHFQIKLKTLLITGSLCIIGLSIVLVSSFMYAYCNKYIIDRTVIYQQKALESVGTNVTDFIDDIDTLAASICENSDILRLLTDKKNDTYQNLVNSREISSLLSSFVYSYSKVSSINIISDNFENINDSHLNGIISTEFVNSSLADQTYKIENSGWFLLNYDDMLSDTLSSSVNGDTTICFFRNIYGKTTSKRLGTLLISCRESVLYDMVRQSMFDSATEAMILDENDMILSHSNKELLGTAYTTPSDSSVVLNQETGQLLVSHKLPRQNWVIMQSLSLSYMTRDLDQIATYTLILTLTIMTLAAVFSTLLSSWVTHPLRHLTNMVKDISQTNLHQNEDTYLLQEIDILNTQFNSMVESIHTLMETVSTEQKEKHATELKLLQAEINPHFIYNTIELINYVAMKNNDLLVCDIVHTFGRFLRLSLNNGKIYLTLAQEIEQVSAYAKLQSLKYEESFDLEWDVAPEILDSYTLNLILQPLVENCLVHGFSKTGGYGHIKITADVYDSDIVITVTDDGTGMDEDISRQILTKATPGYGVYNVNQRIQNVFGNNYGLQYTSALNNGTVVTLRIPYLKEMPKNNN